MLNGPVCIRCGYRKASALAECAHCRFQPLSETDQAKSLVLSPAFDVGETTIGRSPEELSDIALQIQEGKPYAFSQVELGVVMREQRVARATTPRRLVWIGVKWLAPAIALLVLILWLGMRVA